MPTNCQVRATCYPNNAERSQIQLPANYAVKSAGKRDSRGYQYSQLQPNGIWFPAMPIELVELAFEIANAIGEPNYQPETCLINYYQNSGKLGLHQDNTEPILSQLLSVSASAMTANFCSADSNAAIRSKA